MTREAPRGATVRSDRRCPECDAATAGTVRRDDKGYFAVVLCTRCPWENNPRLPQEQTGEVR